MLLGQTSPSVQQIMNEALMLTTEAFPALRSWRPFVPSEKEAFYRDS